MAEFKLVIGDPKTGKSYQIVVTEDNAQPFVGKKIGDNIKGESFDYKGYEFEITGGSDYCGFPMRKDVEGPVRKKVLISEGVGTRNKRKGIRLRRTVCGNTIHERITQISMKILKKGKKSLGEEPESEQADEEKEAPKEEKPEKKEEKKKEKKDEKKEGKSKKEEPKREEKIEKKEKEEKPKKEEKPEKKEEQKQEETPLKEVKGIGPKRAEELKEAGVESAEELAETDPKKLAEETDLSEKQAKKLVDKADKA